MKDKIYRFHNYYILTADPGGGQNQIPGECTISGDVRLTLLLIITQGIY